MMFMGGKIDKILNMGRGPYVFPDRSTSVKFQQLYIVGTKNKISNRKNVVRYVQCHYNTSSLQSIHLI